MNQTIARGPTRNNSITIVLGIDHITQTLCFIVNATNGTLNIEVEGMFSKYCICMDLLQSSSILLCIYIDFSHPWTSAQIIL